MGGSANDITVGHQKTISILTIYPFSFAIYSPHQQILHWVLEARSIEYFQSACSEHGRRQKRVLILLKTKVDKEGE
jgi:hypothetical protein